MSYVATANSGADALQPSRSNTKPGAVAAGDIAVFYLGRWNESASFPAPTTVPSGAVLLATRATGDLQLLVYVKYVVGGETTYTFDWGSSRWATLHSEYFTGRAQGLDLSTLVHDGTTGSGTSITSRSVTAAAGDDLAWAVDCHEYNGGETHTPPTSFTEVYDNEAGSGAYRANVSAGTQTASGATISSSQSFAVELIALPAAGGGGTDFTQTPADTEGVTDGTSKALGKALGDAVGLTETTSFARGLATPDGVGLTDAAAVAFGRATTGADTVGLTDSALIEKALTRAPTDTEGLTDTAALAVGYAQTRTDTEGLADSAALAFNRASVVPDAIGLTDAADVQLSTSASLSLADTAGLTDAVRLDRSMAPADPLGITDQAALARGQVAPDPVGVTDSATVQLAGAGTVSSGDAENLTDAAAISQQKATTDAEGITDAVSVILTRDLGDTVAVSDLADLTSAFARILADTIGMTDEAVPVLNPTDVVIPDEVDATPRPYISTANLGGYMSTATARAQESTATARSPE